MGGAAECPLGGSAGAAQRFVGGAGPDDRVRKAAIFVSDAAKEGVPDSPDQGRAVAGGPAPARCRDKTQRQRNAEPVANDSG